ncbi:MAG: RIP metalloprotease RseP [Xanthomonadales bacterium]|nr:RIP metalloprotease RseP [Xanthomonadales bacterium]
MADFLGSIWWLLVALGLLITFHEFGHFWVARRFGVRVLRFSVGFGRPIWSRRGRDGTEYVVAAIPLGGYVKMLDEREGQVPPEQAHEAFNRQSVWARIAIVAAGPVFNLVFAVLAFWVMFMAGVQEVRPVVGGVEGIAEQAGLEPGDRIVAVQEQPTGTWTHAILALVPPALDREAVRLAVEDEDGDTRTLTLPLDRLGDDFREEETLAGIGIRPWRPELPALVGEVQQDSPADEAGLRVGDRIVRIAGEEVSHWAWVGFLVQEHGQADRPLEVVVERDGIERTLEVTPRAERSGLLSKRLVLGVVNAPPDEALQDRMERAYFVQRYDPVEGLAAAAGEMVRLTSTTIGVLGRMITGSASVRNLSGPISIAQFANDSASAGLAPFLFFLGAISLSLGILNLLPIPVLDGGHLLYFAVELVKGSPVSEQAQVMGQYVGLAALAGLMSLAIVNDILRLFG